MNRRSFLSAVVIAPFVAALAACGDPEGSAVGTDPTIPATVPPTTAPTGVAHPTGADDVVLKLAYEGGFVPVGVTFVNTPAWLVSGDGRVFTQAAVPAIFPGPLLPSLLVRTIDEAGMQALLAIVDDAGLLGPAPDYTGGQNVADAPNTVLTINAAGGSFVHSAYALGIAGADTAASARTTLLDAVNKLSDAVLSAGTGDQPFVATAYRFQSRAVDASELTGQEPAPTVVDWPAGTGIALAEAATCARVDAAAVGSLFIDAKQNTYFKDGEVTYQLAVAGVLPGDPDC